MPPLSIFIIAQNEVDRIGRTIEAARALSDDIILVDSGSTDGTQALAESLGARVIFNAWPGYGQQKRFAEEQCRHDWLLNLDADEVVPPDLAAEIAALFCITVMWWRCTMWAISCPSTPASCASESRISYSPRVMST